MKPDFSHILFGLHVHSIYHFFWHRKHSPSSQFKTDLCCFFFVSYWSTPLWHHSPFLPSCCRVAHELGHWWKSSAISLWDSDLLGKKFMQNIVLYNN